MYRSHILFALLILLFSLLNLFLQTAEGSVIGAINVPIIPRTSAHVTVKLPPSMSNQLITMSQVSSDNDDEVPVVSDMHAQFRHLNLSC